MHTLTATLDEQTYLRVRAPAAARGLAPEQVVAELLHEALEREPAATRAERALDELAERADRLSDQEAMAPGGRPAAGDEGGGACIGSSLT